MIGIRMLHLFVWVALGCVLFWIVTRRTCLSIHGELPLFLLPRTFSRLSRSIRILSMLFFLLFCTLWASTFLSLFFPKLTSSSWLLFFDRERLEPRFAYSATLFIVDRSSSMKTAFNQSTSRLDFAKANVHELVNDIDSQGKGKDAFGLMACARIAPILVPMTRNRSFFFNEVSRLIPEENQQLNGTALGYALFKGVYLLEALEQYAQENRLETLSTKARSIVIITDGLEEPSPYDKGNPYRSMHMREALQQARALGIRVWYLVVAPPSADLASTVERKTLFDLAASTGGGYVELLSAEDSQRELQKIASVILASQESIQEGVDTQLLLGLEFACLCACLACMRLSEYVGYRIG